MYNRENQKVVLIREGNAIFGEIKDFKTIKSSGKVLVTIRTHAGKTVTLDFNNQPEVEGFKLISDAVYEMVTNGESGKEEEIKENADRKFLGVKKNSIVETLILSGRYQGIWVRAKVLRVEENTMDLRVQWPKKWRVAAIALAVPKGLIRTVTDPQTYTIPIEFTVDNTILYVSCNNKMTIRDLKLTVNKARKFPFNQIYFIHDGNWLVSSDSIPNNVIFCIIHRGERLTNNLIDLVFSLKKPKKASLDSKERFET